MLFAHPGFLWLLPAAPLLAYVAWRGRPDRRATAAVLHAMCVTAVVLTLAGPMLAWSDRAATSVRVIEVTPFVTDQAVADSVRGLALDGQSKLIAFASRAERIEDLDEFTDPGRLKLLRQRLAEKVWPDDIDGGGPNLAAALQLASAHIPSNGHGVVHLTAGGASVHGDAAAEAYRLAERGIDLRADAAALSTDRLPAMRVRHVTIAGQARVGQTLRAIVSVDSAIAARGTVNVTAGDGEPVTASFDAQPGMHAVTVDLPLARPGLTAVRAGVAAAGETSTGSSVFAAVDVQPPADVLWVQDPTDPAALAAFARMAGDGVRLKPVAPDALAEEASRADAIVLADTPADRLPARSIDAVLAAVRNGAGLMLTGAARSFGPGGYDDSPLAAALPVKMPQQAESIDPSVTLVLIVDTSGSMMGERMDLAKEIARLAMSHLKPHDKVGIVEFYGGKRWAAPIQTAANVSIIQRALDRLTPGGGTTLYPAVEEAAFALKNVRTRGKHLLILSDGAVEDGKFAALLRQMAEDGVVISAVQVGPPDSGPFANLMPDFARWGNGRYYTVPDAYALPDISFKQPQISMLSPVQRTPVVVRAGDDELTRNAFATGDVFTNGYVRTQAKPTADVLLKTDSGDPLLARWRYGSGYVATLPTQIGSTMTASLSAEFANVLRGVVRQLSDGRGQPLSMTATVRPAGIEVDITATAEGADPMRPLTVSLRDAADRELRRMTADPVSPGRWNVLFPNVTAGIYAVSAIEDGSPLAGSVGVAVPEPIATVSRQADRDALARLQAFNKLAADRAAALPAARPVFVDLTPWAGLASVIFLIAHVAWRRWPLVTGR